MNEQMEIEVRDARTSKLLGTVTRAVTKSKTWTCWVNGETHPIGDAKGKPFIMADRPPKDMMPAAMTFDILRGFLGEANKNLVSIEKIYEDAFNVSFFANESAFFRNVRSVVILTVQDGYAQSSSSSCLPTNSWVEVAGAYARAAAFMKRSGLKDFRPSANQKERGSK